MSVWLSQGLKEWSKVVYQTMPVCFSKNSLSARAFHMISACWHESLTFSQGSIWSNSLIRFLSRHWFVTGSSVKSNFLLRVFPLSMHTLWRTIRPDLPFELLLYYFHISLEGLAIFLSTDHNNLRSPFLLYSTDN